MTTRQTGGGEGAVRLSARQYRVIRWLSSRRQDVDGAPSAIEVARAIGMTYDQAIGHLVRLEARGLVRRLGHTLVPPNARTWTVTPAGRLALSQHEGKE